VSVTSVAQAVWSYTPRSLTDIQSLTAAIQNNDPSLLSTLSDLQYVPVPYYAGQVTADQAATFIDNLIRNYNMPGAIANFITNYMYGPWTPNTVGAFLSSLNMSQTSVTLLLAYAGATQMAQALSNLSGNYTNVAIAFSLLVAPSTGANVLNNMSVTQAASIINNALINIAPSYPTSVAQLLSLVSSSVLANINAYSNVSATTLNQVISNAALSATAAQAILYTLAQNYYYNMWINIVTANAGSTTIATNVTISSPLYSQNLTVASGVTVTCGTNTCFFVAQSFNNYGTIVNPYGATGAPSPGAYMGNGGTGGGGIAVIAVTATLGNLNVAGLPGGVGNSGTTIATSGGNGGTGVFYVVTGVVVPVGGSGAGGSVAGKAGVNGGGGGAVVNQGGAGGLATLYAFASANSMLTYIMQGLSDWWLIKVLGKAPSSTTPLAFMYGSGGGAGSGEGSGNAGGGGGGGGGGEVVVYAFNVVSGTINAVGGTGGGSPGNGGGGGGGGLVFILYGATSGNLTASVNGGIGGDIGGTGLAGANSTAYIVAVTVNG
jgi:hypothetical protein